MFIHYIVRVIIDLNERHAFRLLSTYYCCVTILNGLFSTWELLSILHTSGTIYDSSSRTASHTNAHSLLLFEIFSKPSLRAFRLRLCPRVCMMRWVLFDWQAVWATQPLHTQFVVAGLEINCVLLHLCVKRGRFSLCVCVPDVCVRFDTQHTTHTLPN